MNGYTLRGRAMEDQIHENTGIISTLKDGLVGLTMPILTSSYLSALGCIQN